MSQSIDLGSRIASLRNETGSGLVRRLVDPDAPVRVFLGIDPADGQLGVLVAVHRNHIPARRDLPGGAGFQVRQHVIADDGRDVVNLGVFCADSASEDIFIHFMHDLVAHLLAEASHDAAVRVFLDRVSLWQAFFVPGGGEPLSEESQCGLFAELLVLRDLVIPAVGPPSAIDCWKGPEKKPQDFVLPGGAIEVKCTRAKAGARIPVASEQQLDERPFPRLVLAHLAVTLGAGANPSLVDLVGEIRGLLAASGRPLGLFNDRLLAAGWLDAHSERYNGTRFFVREWHLYEVRDGFPRIRPGDLPLGLADITYTLDPSALTSFEVERPTVEGWLNT